MESSDGRQLTSILRPQRALHHASMVGGNLTQLGYVFDHDARRIDHDTYCSQLREGA